MFDDDAGEKAPDYTLGDDLSRFSLEELTALLSRLSVEAGRVQEEIDRKSDVKSAADTFFR